MLASLLQLIFERDLNHILHVIQLALEAFEFQIAVINRLLNR
jgi:hypothetical protein